MVLMVQAVRNDDNRITQHNGIGGKPAQVQNAAASPRWSVPTHGNLVGGGTRIATKSWQISLFVDARFDNDNTPRTLLTFPDRSELQLIGRDQIRYRSGDALHTIDPSRAIPNHGWAHIGVQMCNRNRTATLYHNGFALHTGPIWPKAFRKTSHRAISDLLNRSGKRSYGR
jgi:hypothetical protein